MIEDGWTRRMKEKIRQFKIELSQSSADAWWLRDWVEGLEEEVVEHLERKANDTSNVIVLDYYRAKRSPAIGGPQSSALSARERVHRPTSSSFAISVMVLSRD